VVSPLSCIKHLVTPQNAPVQFWLLEYKLMPHSECWDLLFSLTQSFLRSVEPLKYSTKYFYFLSVGPFGRPSSHRRSLFSFQNIVLLQQFWWKIVAKSISSSHFVKQKRTNKKKTCCTQKKSESQRLVDTKLRNHVVMWCNTRQIASVASCCTKTSVCLYIAVISRNSVVG
jgi:hypothetical protein